MVKNINIPLNEDEFVELSEHKKNSGAKSWKQFIFSLIRRIKE